MVMPNGDSKEGYFDNNMYRGTFKEAQPTIAEDLDEDLIEINRGPQKRYNSVLKSH
jgi:hypothetical protein